MHESVKGTEQFEGIGNRLAKMVRIPTVSGAGNEEFYQIGAYRALLEKEFSYLFQAAKKHPVGEALLLELAAEDTGKPPVLFTGHMDVVPAKDSDAWQYPPFSGHMENGCIWGRGAQDMKGPQCALLSAFDLLLQKGWKPGRHIWLYLSCDEEVGGQTTQKAADWLAQQGIHFETVFDEGGTVCEDYMGLVKGKAALFGIAEKGSLEYRFTALDAGGHAANPPERSAIVRLAEVVLETQKEGVFVRGLTEGSRAMLRAAAQHCPQDLREEVLRAAKEEGTYETLYKICPDAKTLLGATIAFTMAAGGTAFNVLPKRVELTANVRVSAVETQEEVTRKLQQIAEKHGVTCTLEGGNDASPESSEEAPGYQAMKASVQEAYPGMPVIPFVLGGGTDSKHFLPLTDEVLRFSPMYAQPWQGKGVHGDNEAADEKAVADAAVCYSILLEKYL